MGAETSFQALASTILSVGFASWLAWFLITHSIPKMQDNFMAAIREEREAFTRILDAERLEHRAQVGAEREARQTDTREFVGVIREFSREMNKVSNLLDSKLVMVKDQHPAKPERRVADESGIHKG